MRAGHRGTHAEDRPPDPGDRGRRVHLGVGDVRQALGRPGRDGGLLPVRAGVARAGAAGRTGVAAARTLRAAPDRSAGGRAAGRRPGAVGRRDQRGRRGDLDHPGERAGGRRPGAGMGGVRRTPDPAVRGGRAGDARRGRAGGRSAGRSRDGRRSPAGRAVRGRRRCRLRGIPLPIPVWGYGLGASIPGAHARHDRGGGCRGRRGPSLARPGPGPGVGRDGLARVARHDRAGVRMAVHRSGHDPAAGRGRRHAAAPPADPRGRPRRPDPQRAAEPVAGGWLRARRARRLAHRPQGPRP